LRDESLEDSDKLPEPDILAREIVEDLQAALVQFQAIRVYKLKSYLLDLNITKQVLDLKGRYDKKAFGSPRRIRLSADDSLMHF
jgi:hypothetical protein